MRVIIPWEEIDDQTKQDMGYVRCDAYPEGKLATYEMIERRCTRPITPDDVRGMIRMPDEWTEKEREGFFKKCNRFTSGNARFWANTNALAATAINIATRPAPEPDPWDALDQSISAVLMNCSEYMGTDELALAKAWNRLKATRGEK